MLKLIRIRRGAVLVAPLAAIIMTALTIHLGAAVNPAVFRDRVDYATSISQTSAVGDVNGDGILDLMNCGNGGAQVQIGDGHGSFKAGPMFTSGNLGCGIPLLIDLNGDGRLDLAMSYGTGLISGLGIAIGNGDGTFQPLVTYAAGNDVFGYMIVAGDFNNDGKTDFTILGQDGVWMFLGQGKGIFSPGALISVNSAAYGGFSLATADFNSDGNLDLAVGTTSGFVVLLGNGNGSFQLPQPTPTGQVDGIFVADVNDDRKPDVIVTTQAHPNLVLLLDGNGDGTFQHFRSIELPNQHFIAIGDVNGDGELDLVSNTGYVAFGKGAQKFSTPAYFPNGTNGTIFQQGEVLLADLRNSGHVDMVVTHSGSFTVLLNKGKGSFVDGTYLKTNGSPSCPVVADFNHDGKSDLAIASNGEVMIYLGTGKAAPFFEAPQSIAIPGAYCLAGADFNKDGNLDLAVLANGTAPTVATVTTLIGDGAGGFNPLAVLNSRFVLGGPLLADFNRDGNLDLAFTGNAISYGNGDGTFGPVTRITTNLPSLNAFATIAVEADFNGDNLPDLAFPDIFNNIMYVLLNRGNGRFSVTSFGASATYCITADVNGDGKTDMLCNTITGDIVFYLGAGDGTFQMGSTIKSPFFQPNGLLFADLNGDGIPDLGQVNEQSFGIFQGNSDGTFQMPIWFGAGPMPIVAATANLHGQGTFAGVPDVILTDGTGPLLILQNTTSR